MDKYRCSFDEEQTVGGHQDSYLPSLTPALKNNPKSNSFTVEFNYPKHFYFNGVVLHISEIAHLNYSNGYFNLCSSSFSGRGESPRASGRSVRSIVPNNVILFSEWKTIFSIVEGKGKKTCRCRLVFVLEP